MNLMYEEFPMSILLDGEEIPIVTDFREYVKLMDILEDTDLSPYEKRFLVSQFFLPGPPDNFEGAMDALAEFATMKVLNNSQPESDEENEERRVKKELYSFKVDYPFIFSAFLRDYGINIRTVKYMHWWEFRMLFDGLSEDTEIKQRIMYRNIDLSKIKDREERKRIERIQRSIKLPDDTLSDYDIGEAFGW